MNVCIDLTPLSTRSRFRGIGGYALALLRAIGRAGPLLDGLRVHALVGRGLSLRLAPLDAHDATSPSAFGAPLPYQIYYKTKLLRAARVLAAGGVDVYHATDPKGTPRARGIATVVTCHDLIPTVLGRPYLPLLWPRGANLLLERWRYLRRAHVICISESTRRDLQRLLPIPPDRISVVYSGVDLEQFQPTPADDDRARVRRLIGSDRPYFLYVGGFDVRKQVPLLVEAFARRAAEIDQVLAIGGKIDPGERRELERRASAQGVRDRVVFLGFVPDADLPALYRGATAHALLSTYEGFGLTVLEAFASGCPVVALRATAIPEVAGDAALLIEPAGPEGHEGHEGHEGLDVRIGAALVKIAKDAALRDELRARGLARAPQFSWDRCAAGTLAVYRKAREAQ